MTALLAMVALAAACWVLRALFIVFVPADRLPAPVHAALTHLAPAVLAAAALATGFGADAARRPFDPAPLAESALAR